MDFGWLKRIFKKKNLSNTNTSDLATIDTSFIVYQNCQSYQMKMAIMMLINVD